MAQRGRPRKTTTAHSTEEAIDMVTKDVALDRAKNEKSQNSIYASSSKEGKSRSREEKAEEIKLSIYERIAMLQDVMQKPKCNLKNMDDVQSRTLTYMTACAETGAFPSVMGLAVYGFGLSRQALYNFLKMHPDSDTAQYIMAVKEMMAEVLTDASLKHNADSIQAIFQLKNHFEHSDKQEITIIPGTNDTQTAEELVSEVDALPE